MGKILITGSKGLVGSQFIGDEYIRTTSDEYNLKIPSESDMLLKQHNDISGVIHCAARVGGLGESIAKKGEFFYDNLMINTNVIESARKFKIEKLVAFLSTCSFPNDVNYPLTEEKIHNGPPHHTNESYSYAKRMVDIQIKSYREQYGLQYKTVIPTNIYGINDNFDISNGHVIPSLIHKCYLSRENNTPLHIWGSGEPLREFIYNKDVAYLTEWILKNYNEDEPIILSPSEEISIKDIVDIIVELMYYKGEVIFDIDKPDGQYRKSSDNNKIKTYLPDFKFTPIYEGLKETISWFESQYPNIRK
tara:strand:+ start:180 stop:1094 length:915 start_codon:yes stop_codon:yes gene_type:complete